MSKHTPGPWRVAECGTKGCWCRTIVADVPDIVDDGDSDFHIITSGSLRKHNANLVAAAPELLEALKRLQLAYTNSHSPSVRADCWKQAADAIAKATGETL